MSIIMNNMSDATTGPAKRVKVHGDGESREAYVLMCGPKLIHHTASSPVGQPETLPNGSSVSESTKDGKVESEDEPEETGKAPSSSTANTKQKHPGVKERIQACKIGLQYFDEDEKDYRAFFNGLKDQWSYTTQGSFPKACLGAFQHIAGATSARTSGDKDTIAAEGKLMHEDFIKYIEAQDRIKSRLSNIRPGPPPTTTTYQRWINGLETPRDNSTAEQHLAMLKRAIRKQTNEAAAIPVTKKVPKTKQAKSSTTADATKAVQAPTKTNQITSSATKLKKSSNVKVVKKSQKKRSYRRADSESSDDYDNDPKKIDEEAEQDSEGSFSVTSDSPNGIDEEDIDTDQDDKQDSEEISEDEEEDDAQSEPEEVELIDHFAPDPRIAHITRLESSGELTWEDLLLDPIFGWDFMKNRDPAYDVDMDAANFKTKLYVAMLQDSADAFSIGWPPRDIVATYSECMHLVNYRKWMLYRPDFIAAARDVMAELYLFTRGKQDLHHESSFLSGSPTSLEFRFGMEASILAYQATEEGTFGSAWQPLTG